MNKMNKNIMLKNTNEWKKVISYTYNLKVNLNILSAISLAVFVNVNRYFTLQ